MSTSLLIIIPFILYLIYPRMDFIISQIDKNRAKDYCYLNSLRKDSCYKNKVNTCPLTSYKQCTNNHYSISKCNCLENSYELCSTRDKTNERCYYNIIKNRPDIHIYANNSRKNPRVNIINTKKTYFDQLA